MSLKDKTARQSLTNYPSAELKNYLKQHPTTATSPTCTSALEPMSIGADGCSPSVSLGTNKNGSPKHPLYIKTDTNLIEWRP